MPGILLQVMEVEYPHLGMLFDPCTRNKRLPPPFAARPSTRPCRCRVTGSPGTSTTRTGRRSGIQGSVDGGAAVRSSWPAPREDTDPWWSGARRCPCKGDRRLWKVALESYGALTQSVSDHKARIHRAPRSTYRKWELQTPPVRASHSNVCTKNPTSRQRQRGFQRPEAASLPRPCLLRSFCLEKFGDGKEATVGSSQDLVSSSY